MVIPGTNFSGITGLYGESHVIVCDAGLQPPASLFSTVVTCSEEGLWEYEDLSCSGRPHKITSYTAYVQYLIFSTKLFCPNYFVCCFTFVFLFF